jgi:predicted anti-sigma-YlaC factor YlaD
MPDMSQVVQPLIPQKKRETKARRYEIIIGILTTVVSAAGGYIMVPKIFLPEVDSTKLSAILLGITGLIVGCVFGLFSYRKKSH